MKKNGILNSEISAVIATLGHTDTIVVCDCGYPIPAGAKRIDLALRRGTPGILEVLEELHKELETEKVVFADESKDACPELIEEAVLLLGRPETESIPHAEFKQLARKATAFIRTGETVPYSNLILQSGVAF